MARAQRGMALARAVDIRPAEALHEELILILDRALHVLGEHVAEPRILVGVDARVKLARELDDLLRAELLVEVRIVDAEIAHSREL